MSQEKKQSLVSRITPAGWLALVVVTIFIVGVVGNLVKAAVPYNRLQPITPQPTYTPTVAPTATPELDTDAAWETFMQVINKCGTLPDQGDDLSKYPQSLEELTADVKNLTTDSDWLGWCGRFDRLLSEFGPQNISCKGDKCEAAVSVHHVAGFSFMEAWCEQNADACTKMKNEHLDLYNKRIQDRIIISRPPKFFDENPFQLIKGTLIYQEGRWIVTKVQVEILPPPPDSTATPQP